MKTEKSNDSFETESLCITAALRAASRKLTMLYDEAMAPSGLRVTQYSLLSELERRADEPPTVGEFSEILTMERSALGQTLKTLESEGLVELSRDAQDGRRRPVVLTKKGRSAILRARPYWKKAHTKLEKYFGKEAFASLRTTLREVARDPELSDAIKEL